MLLENSPALKLNAQTASRPIQKCRYRLKNVLTQNLNTRWKIVNSEKFKMFRPIHTFKMLCLSPKWHYTSMEAFIYLHWIKASDVTHTSCILLKCFDTLHQWVYLIKLVIFLAQYNDILPSILLWKRQVHSTNVNVGFNKCEK